VKLLLSGRAQFAVLDIHDLAIARQRGRDVVGVMALVQRPLAAVLAQPEIRTPRNLQGKRAGVTGLPSDDAVLRSVVSGAGGDPSAVRKVTIGFDAVPALLGRRVAAATAFWNVEGVALRRKRPGIREFRVDQYGAPSYPELVLCATRQTIRDDPGLVRATVHSIQRGYDEVLKDPDSAADQLADRVPGLDRALVHAEMDAVETSFDVADGKVGSFDERELRRWSRWEAKFGIVRRPVDVNRAFDPAFTR
jgi:putative hydroxymethylpyrimidine transport system substrate-binding protein